MACMEHRCMICDHMEFDNFARYPLPCPMCGGKNWLDTWDEELDHGDDDRYDNCYDRDHDSDDCDDCDEDEE